MNKWVPISYGVFLVLFSLFSYLFVDPNLVYLHSLFTGIAFQNRTLVTVFYVAVLVIFFSYYIYFISLVFRNKISFPQVKLLLGLSLVLTAAYPAMLSYDIFNYLATAKVLYFYHENPYILMPIEFHGDPLLLFMHAPNKVALYGPTWIFTSIIPYILGLGNFLTTLFLFKIMTAFSFIASLMVFYKLNKNLSSLVLFGLNPLVLIETLLSGHNDMIMIGLVLLAFLMVQKKKLGVGLFSFLLSIGVKYASLFLLPVFIFIICWKKLPHPVIYRWATILMFFIFLLSPLREELYPWYAIWFLPFLFLSEVTPLMTYCSIGLSFGLLLRYVPFMLLGTYFGPTPLLKIILTITPLCLSIIMYVLWRRKFFHFL